MDEDRRTAEESERFGRPSGVSHAAAGVGMAAYRRAGFDDPRVVTNWSEIVGRRLAALCLPLKLSGGVLTLLAQPGAEVFLSYETRGLIDRLRAYMGQDRIARVKFVAATPIEGEPEALAHRVAAETVPQDDPTRRFVGPERLGDALQRLARARAGRTVVRRG
jgi:hypothetical protein